MMLCWPFRNIRWLCGAPLVGGVVSGTFLPRALCEGDAFIDLIV